MYICMHIYMHTYMLYMHRKYVEIFMEKKLLSIMILSASRIWTLEVEGETRISHSPSGNFIIFFRFWSKRSFVESAFFNFPWSHQFNNVTSPASCLLFMLWDPTIRHLQHLYAPSASALSSLRNDQPSLISLRNPHVSFMSHPKSHPLPHAPRRNSMLLLLSHHST